MILASLTRLCGDGFAVPDRAFICGSNRNVRAQEGKRFCGNVWPAFQEVLIALRADSALQKRGLNHLHLFYKQFAALVINPGPGRIAIREATAIAASDQNGDDQWRGKRLFLTNAF